MVCFLFLKSELSQTPRTTYLRVRIEFAEHSTLLCLKCCKFSLDTCLITAIVLHRLCFRQLDGDLFLDLSQLIVFL